MAHQQQQQQVARQEHPTRSKRNVTAEIAMRATSASKTSTAHFGREHHFRVSRSEDRRFNYGGYYWVTTIRGPRIGPTPTTSTLTKSTANTTSSIRCTPASAC